MKILSFDIGIKNLAYCLMDENNIYDWNVINLLDNTHNCNISNCKNNIFYIYNKQFFCKKHIDNSLMLFKKDYLISNIKKKTNKEIISIMKELKLHVENNKELNAKKLKFYYENNCYKSYTKLNGNTIDLIDVGKVLNKKLNTLLVNSEYDIVLIENQIGPLANRMKTLQGMLTQYFIIKDKGVKYVSSQNKLKLLDTKGKNYTQRKQLAIAYVPIVLEKLTCSDEMIENFNSSKKKDDLSDCLLQGWSFLSNNINI